MVGLGRFGATLAATLCANGGEVMAIDINGERVEAIRDHVTHCVQANGMNREALVQLGVRDFDVAVVAIDGDLRASCMTTMLMKELGVNTSRPVRRTGCTAACSPSWVRTRSSSRARHGQARGA